MIFWLFDDVNEVLLLGEISSEVKGHTLLWLSSIIAITWQCFMSFVTVS